MTLAAPVLAAAGSSPRALWYLTRGAGAVTLVGLTGTVALGVTDQMRVASRSWPRFVVDTLHRNLALITLSVLALHIATAVLDTYAPVRLVDTVLPFASAYRPIWLGLGALAFDLLLAVAITSALRRRLGYRAWRAVHWAAYACWPLALVHGLGTGSDTRLTWMFALSGACVLVVLVAVGARLAAARTVAPSRRLAATGAIAAGGIALAVWMAQGPLAPHWSRRAGTPIALVASAAPVAASAPARTSRTAAHAPAPAGLTPPFTASAAGALHQSVAGGSATIDIDLTMHGGVQGSVRVRLLGQALPSGGVALSSGTVALGPPGQPDLYTGPVAALSGGQLAARLSRAGGAALQLRMGMAIDRQAGSVSASVAASPDGTGP